jgi:hypothetical protein
MRLTDTQFYYLKRLVNGPVKHAELRRWDQRPLRGLYLRGLFEFSTKLDGHATRDGWLAHQGTLKPKYRKHPENPLFGRRILKEEPRKRLAQ